MSFPGVLDIVFIGHVFLSLSLSNTSKMVVCDSMPKVAIKQREGEETGKNRARHSLGLGQRKRECGRSAID